jgi:hypothetical protein
MNITLTAKKDEKYKAMGRNVKVKVTFIITNEDKSYYFNSINFDLYVAIIFCTDKYNIH